MTAKLDADFNFVQPCAAVRVVSILATSGQWTPFTIPATPLEPDRYFLQIEAVDEVYELRFDADDVNGIRVPVTTPYTHPFPLARRVVPSIKKATEGNVRALVSFPASP